MSIASLGLDPNLVGRNSKIDCVHARMLNILHPERFNECKKEHVPCKLACTPFLQRHSDIMDIMGYHAHGRPLAETPWSVVLVVSSPV